MVSPSVHSIASDVWVNNTEASRARFQGYSYHLIIGRYLLIITDVILGGEKKTALSNFWELHGLRFHQETRLESISKTEEGHHLIQQQGAVPCTKQHCVCQSYHFLLMEPIDACRLAGNKEPDPRESHSEDREHQGTARDLHTCIARDTRTSFVF